MKKDLIVATFSAVLAYVCIGLAIYQIVVGHLGYALLLWLLALVVAMPALIYARKQYMLSRRRR